MPNERACTLNCWRNGHALHLEFLSTPVFAANMFMTVDIALLFASYPHSSHESLFFHMDFYTFITSPQTMCHSSLAEKTETGLSNLSGRTNLKPQQPLLQVSLTRSTTYESPLLTAHTSLLLTPSLSTAIAASLTCSGVIAAQYNRLAHASPSTK